MNLLTKQLSKWAPVLVLLAVFSSAGQAQAKSIVWKHTEKGSNTIKGRLTWKPEKKHFVGRWDNGAVGIVVLKKLDKSQVVMVRHDTAGALNGLKANYVGTRQGNKVTGTVEWNWNGRVTHGNWHCYMRFPPKAGSKRPLDLNRFPAERHVLEGPQRKFFPYLGSNFEVLAPSTPTYNCIAWSLGITSQWVWPGKTVAQFDQLYGRYGYRRLKTLDFRVQPGYRKIVLYGKVQNGYVVECTHGARQLNDGTWTSKLGKLARIRHLTPNDVNGPSYGQPIFVYVKPVRA